LQLYWFLFSIFRRFFGWSVVVVFSFLLYCCVDACVECGSTVA
jgi:hypothetical protein